MLAALQRTAASAAVRHAARPAARRAVGRSSGSLTARWLSTAPPATPAPAAAPKVVSKADEQTDAEAGLSQPVQSKQQKEQQQRAEQEAEDAEEEAEQAERLKAERKKNTQPITWGSVTFLTLVGGGALVYFLYEQDKQMNTIRTESIGTPLLGGPWSLTNDQGKRVTSADLHGKYVLMYFGFTFCPDICPKELERIDEIVRKFDTMGTGQTIVPLFISLDPKRDTPKRLAEYKLKWNPAIQWLTGTDEELKKTARDFRIYYSSSETAEGADDDYLIDHSIFFYLMDREGKFLEYFGSKHTPEEIAVKAASLIGAENKK